MECDPVGTKTTMSSREFIYKNHHEKNIRAQPYHRKEPGKKSLPNTSGAGGAKKIQKTRLRLGKLLYIFTYGGFSYYIMPPPKENFLVPPLLPKFPK